MNSPIRLLFLGLLIVVANFSQPSESVAQGKKMIVGQAGVNPGAGLFSIAVKEGLYQKHGLEVEIIKTNTTAAVQAMLANKMQMATGAGAAAFVTATLEGAPPFVLVGSWVNVFPYKIMAQKGIKKIDDMKGKTGHVGAPFDLIAERRGYEMLLALQGLGIPWQQNGELVPASYLTSNRDNVVRFMGATADASKFYFDQKEKTIE